MEKILITGFEVFGAYKENITQAFSEEIFNLSGYSPEYIIFPVRIFSEGSENYGKQIIKRAQEINAKAIISLGMASDVKGARIESLAKNWVENEKYCTPSEQKRLIDKNLEAKHSLRVDLEKWNTDKIISDLKELNVNYESEISVNANSFCCNALMFRTLQALESSGCSIPYIFLHVSCSPESVEGVANFNSNNHLISIGDLKDILGVFLKNL